MSAEAEECPLLCEVVVSNDLSAEAEECPLLEAVTKQRPAKTEDFVFGVVTMICRLYTTVGVVLVTVTSYKHTVNPVTSANLMSNE
jgi:hypothetical protein